MAGRTGPGRIGTQIWMLKNLDVDVYRNGDPIPEVQDYNEWLFLTTGAWCYYNNDPANGEIYGKLYNWYAVNDPRGLAPVGYHVPSENELYPLIDYLGGDYLIAGGAMKEIGTTHWQSPNTGATNSSDWTGLPGGRVSPSGFDSLGYVGFWWTTSSAAGEPRFYQLYSNDTVLNRSSDSAYIGHSVRCIKD
jgi:uncharacterized protein (TIGR02145 family)